MQAWTTCIRNDGLRWIRVRLPQLVSVLLTGLIVAEGARLVLPLVPSQAFASVPMSVDRPPRHRIATVDPQAIVARHLFGVAENDEMDDSSGPAPASANLVLQGTLAASNPHRGYAIISTDGQAQVHKVGDELAGATLDSIYSDRILLKRGRRIEALPLPRYLAARTDTAVASSAATAALPPPVTDDPGPHRGTPKTVGELMRADPATDEESNKLEGFRLHPGRTGAAFIHAGLRPGDILTAVNGTPLVGQDPQTSQAFVNSMLASDHASVSVLRNGKPVELSVDLSQ